jgi:O-antigen/teichoic acid export membrane protein
MNITKAISYNFLGKIIRLLGTFIVLAVYGRYISTEELGLFAAVFVTYQIFLPILEGGLVNSFLKSDGATTFHEGLHTITIVAVLILATIFLIFKGMFEYIYSIEIPNDLYFIFLIYAVVASLSVQRRAYLLKKKLFNQIFWTEVIAFLISSICTVVLAVKGYGYLALVLKLLIESLILYLIYNFGWCVKIRLRFRLPSNEEKRLVFYGFRIAYSRLISGLTGSLDKVVMGAMFTSSSLGFYFYSKNLVSMPDQILRTSLTNPLLSYISHSEDTSAIYQLQIIAVVMNWIVIPPLAIILGFGDIFIVILMGPDWAEFGINIRVMSLLGMAMCLKGWLSIVFINSMRMVEWNRIVLLELGLFVILIVGCFYLKPLVQDFIFIITLFFFIFWCLFYCVFCTNNNSGKESAKILNIMFSNQLVLVFIGLSIVSYVLRENIMLEGFASLATGFLFQLLILTPMFVLFLASFFFLTQPSLIKLITSGPWSQ